MAFDLEALLAALPSPSDTGENLEYDPAFAALERALAGKAEQQIGNTIVAAEPPDWGQVEARATELLLRSKDLRPAAALTCTLAVRRGLPGFADGIGLIRSLLERYWPTLHPQLDPDDPTDATMRVNALAGLTESRLFAILRSVPLVQSRSFGPIAWKNLQRTDGAAPPLDPASADAAFAEVPQEQVVGLVAAMRLTLTHLEAIEGAFAPVSRGPDLTTLSQLLREIVRGLEPRIHVEETTSEGISAEAAGPPGVASARGAPGEVRSRDDVLRAIDAICKYYAAHEPSSPVPVLLGRCKRLVTMSFAEILQEMVPDALPQLRVIAGKTEE
jgi:type VI secretion system protein ImpA